MTVDSGRPTSHAVEWGREVLARLELDGDETVLDAGCGTGRVTRLLADRLPEGRVIGVDAAPSMIELARENSSPTSAIGSSCGSSICSTSSSTKRSTRSSRTPPSTGSSTTQRLFERLFAALRPGRRTRGPVRGAGQHRRVDARDRSRPRATSGSRPTCAGCRRPRYFASVGDTEARLARAGFEVGRVWLENEAVAATRPARVRRPVGARQAPRSAAADAARRVHRRRARFDGRDRSCSSTSG